MISRKHELESLIEENNNIKKIYLEAYSKRAENEPARKEEEAPQESNQEPNQEAKEETKVVAPEPVPQIDVAALQQEAERKGLERACSALSKLFVLSNMFTTSFYTAQMEEVSGMDELNVLVDFRNELLERTTDNLAVISNANTRFVDFVNSAPTTGTSTKSMDFVSDLVERVVSNQHFADLTLKPYVEPVVEKVQEVVEETTQQVEELPSKSRKESQKQREQHDMFMVEDDEEEKDDDENDNNNEVEVKEEVVMTETKQEEKQPLQEQTTNKQVEKEKPKNLDDGEEEWVEVNKGKSHYEKREYHNGRGGRGRGGRGGRGRGNRDNYNRDNRDNNYKRGDGKDGERRERKEGDGERRPYTRGDGEGRENNYRGGRGRGGRGRGGRGGKRGDGQLERKKENDRPEGEQNLKQVGTKDNVEVNDAPVQQVESQE